MKFLKSTLAALSLFVVFLGSAQAQTVADKTQIIQAAIDMPELDQYFKSKEKDAPKQLYIVDNGKILKTLKLQKFGKPVIITGVSNIPANTPFIEFAQADFKSASADLSYKVANSPFKANIKFNKKGTKWTRVSADVNK